VQNYFVIFFYLINFGIINGPCARFRDNRILASFLYWFSCFTLAGRTVLFFCLIIFTCFKIDKQLNAGCWQPIRHMFLLPEPSPQSHRLSSHNPLATHTPVHQLSHLSCVTLSSALVVLSLITLINFLVLYVSYTFEKMHIVVFYVYCTKNFLN
jgi:hypothetical protein